MSFQIHRKSKTLNLFIFCFSCSDLESELNPTVPTSAKDHESPSIDRYADKNPMNMPLVDNK